MDNQAFWLGAEVGRTESISHVPTQITNYKGSTTPLSDKELSFFKGYLLRSGTVAKKYQITIRLYSRIRFTSDDGNVYLSKTDKTSAGGWHIILNSQKEKIDSEGNILPENDISCFSGGTIYLNLPEGIYYYRNIKNIKDKLAVEDVMFTVVPATKVQYVYIYFEPKLVKMTYHSNGLTMENVTNNEWLSIAEKTFVNDYDKFYPMSASIRIEHIPWFKFDYNIEDISVGEKSFSDKFEFSWEDSDYQNGLLGSSWNYPNGVPLSLEEGEKSSSVALNQDGTLIRDTFYLLQKDITSVGESRSLPCKFKYSCNMDGTSSYSYATIYIANSAKYICDIVFSRLHQVYDILNGTVNGYYCSNCHWHGEEYSGLISDYEILSIKGHPTIEIKETQSAAIQKDEEGTFFYWGKDAVSSSSSSGGKTIKNKVNNEYNIPDIKRKSYLEKAFVWIYNKCSAMVNATNQSLLTPLWYYETDDGVCEACQGTKHYTNKYVNSSFNPTIEDDSKITKAFIAAPIFYNEIKEGYENYFE